ncbi:MAG: hypothetical protein V1793_12060 [Pseudomonadota bacterium]
MKTFLTEFYINENSGIDRYLEPVRWGIPFPRGMIKYPIQVMICDALDRPCSYHGEPIALWDDNSIKVLCVYFQVSISAGSKTVFKLYTIESVPVSPDQGTSGEKALISRAIDGGYTISTGYMSFEMNPHSFIVARPPDNGTEAQHSPICRCFIEMRDSTGTIRFPEWENCILEDENPFCAVVRFKGWVMVSGPGGDRLNLTARIRCYAGHPWAAMEVTVTNPKAAMHVTGVWDLGDGNSIYLKDFRVRFRYEAEEAVIPFIRETMYSDDISGDSTLLVYQDSSGGDYWDSKNHVNRNGDIPVTFRGYRLTGTSGHLGKGNRATPVAAIQGSQAWIGVTIKAFWQNFPKTLACLDNEVVAKLFPDDANQEFELQGGEQKTHEILLCVGIGVLNTTTLNWFHNPLFLEFSPKWYSLAMVFPGFLSGNTADNSSARSESAPDTSDAYFRMIHSVVDGPHAFSQKNEIMDEFGWRNFGDLYADHEAVFHKGSEGFISHYNNQYDVIMSAVVHFLRTGDSRWYSLARTMADHVADIDIYHTDQDRYQYNHGMFWHTDHYLDAETSTHRCVSAKHRKYKDARLVGGGPSCDHCYAGGFLFLYWLTGNERYRDCTLELAGNIVANLDGPDTIAESFYLTLKKLKKKLRKKNCTTSTASEDVYTLMDGPGRASGNALNVLLDAYLLVNDEYYLNQAEVLILRNVRPGEKIVERNLSNPELRWMYTIFLKALCRYAWIKKETQHPDGLYDYAVSVLKDYGKWMVDNEYLYLEKPHLLEFPNETWAAQEFRKSDVLAKIAELHTGEARAAILERGRYFFDNAIGQLLGFDTWAYTRPLALMMGNGMDYLRIYDLFAKKRLPPPVPARNSWRTIKIKHTLSKQRQRKVVKLFSALSLKREWEWITKRIEDRRLP